MRHRLGRSVLAVAVAVLAACSDRPSSVTAPDSRSAPVAAAPFAQIPEFQQGVVVARFAGGAPVETIAGRHGAAVTRDIGLGMRVLRVPAGRERVVAAALGREPGVLFAELSLPRTVGLPCGTPSGDCAVPSDGLLGRRWDLHNNGTIRDAAGNVLSTLPTPDADMDWLEAFDHLGAFAGGAVLGVVDTGIYGAHEDLSGRLIAQHDFFNVDAIAEDDLGHGTHVSGIALAFANNAKGAAGVAYGPNVKLVMAKGCGDTIIGYICWSPDVADGIRWAADRANVINISLGGTEPSAAEQAALQYAQSRNVLSVCAAGNEHAAVSYPAAFPECMAVSATNWHDRRATYSNAGPEVAVSAPGGDTIEATGYDMIVSSWNNGGYVYAAGTSMASPQVAGLAVLLHALGVTSAAQKRSIIRSTSDDLGVAGYDWVYGSGRINVYRAVMSVLPPPPPPNQAPTAAFTYGCTELACSFTDGSSDADGSVVGWSWSFGDGGTATTASPSHTYAAAGTYTVSLTVTDNGGLTGAASHSVTVTGPPPPPNQGPAAAFTFSCTNLACAFTDGSSDTDGTVVGWSWTFGDGYGSTLASPTHTYALAGTYQVSLTVTDNGGLTGTTQKSVTVSSPAIVLSLTASKEKGQHVVDLAWTGGAGAMVDVYRNGVVIATVPRTPGSYHDAIGSRGRATYVYKVCEAGTTTCSAERTATFS